MMSVSILRLVTRIAVVLVVIGLAPPLPAQKSGQSASEFYLSYLAAVEKMKSLKELVPFMPNLPLAAAVLLVRFSISQMDVPTRQSYTIAVVAPDERSAAACRSSGERQPLRRRIT